MDLLDLLVEIEAGPLVAPPRYTTEVFPPHELERAWDAWVQENGRLGSVYRCHQWRPDPLRSDAQAEASGHAYLSLVAWLGCDFKSQHGPEQNEMCQCVGKAVRRAWCEPCAWASPIVGTAAEAIAAWHDHAWPGWRDLPVLGKSVPFDTKAAARWAAQHIGDTYPATWMCPGAPVVTYRGEFGQRDVANRSPWGGFDLAEGTTKL